MDLYSIDSVLIPRDRVDLSGLGTQDGVLAGGTWLMSQPQPGLRRLVDLTGMRWPDLVVDAGGLEVAATCSIERLINASYPPAWQATALFGQCARALLASFKIWRTATVGGNICLGLPAGAMISLCAALDAELHIWRHDGTDERCTITEFVTGINETVLHPGDVLRAITFPSSALSQPTALRKIAYSPLGRSGALVTGRLDGADIVLGITAATRRPIVLRVPAEARRAREAVAAIPGVEFHTDAHGTAEWRGAVTTQLAGEVAAELTGALS
ncbi:FAD binding domain-containing protein [Mycobacteroides abscessus]|uniref:FAD binding domain-containing protein n=1 Tax=Mycobacteroides abscessus TaxID=36809 RepID=UPI0005E1CF36|nr:FAD binding domain-containing protein [Mycobacteroides abscessus]CPW36247.1 Putative oxidoreductase (molybdopterin dehydrogenase?) [Mycobacteroides abscessus]SKE90443.1 Putative oxidoreductase (molybdopterin dehydrogenase?) [Mycobacteroides abscessus subsp. bolletii]SKG16660.1 Putative oxidoreductase (molybdopterin dehydrogenase?) [Mycobacteroides abscessus subsp. bolletii]